MNERKRLWKIWYSGYRSAKKIKTYSYIQNPFSIHSPSWFAFNQGWNDYKKCTNTKQRLGQ